jgi:DNA-binding transcriptional LysR family regulator
MPARTWEAVTRLSTIPEFAKERCCDNNYSLREWLMDLYAAMRAFVRVADAHSFSDVARELKVAQSTISKQISALEEHLGVRLVNRTTRALSLTDEGRQFCERSREILDALAEAETLMGAGRVSPSGLVRVGCPATFGRLLIAPRLGRLLGKYPELRIELVMNDGFEDLVEKGLDLGVRIGVLADQNLIARRIGMTARAVFGSPAYFALHGFPKTPHDLGNHNCIIYTNLRGSHWGDEWRFTSPNARRVNIRVRGNFLADNAEAMREAVLSGIGVAVMPNWMFYEESAAGLVTTVLRDFALERLPLHLIYPSRRLVSAKVRTVSDFLADEFLTEPALVVEGDSGDTA